MSSSSSSSNEEAASSSDMSGDNDFTKTELTESKGKLFLRDLLSRTLRVRIRDGRVLVGTFLCTDRDQNIILSGCEQFVPPKDDGEQEDPFLLGLVMIPGDHIISIEVRHGTDSFSSEKDDLGKNHCPA